MYMHSQSIEVSTYPSNTDPNLMPVINHFAHVRELGFINQRVSVLVMERLIHACVAFSIMRHQNGTHQHEITKGRVRPRRGC